MATANRRSTAARKTARSVPPMAKTKPAPVPAAKTRPAATPATAANTNKPSQLTAPKKAAAPAKAAPSAKAATAAAKPVPVEATPVAAPAKVRKLALVRDSFTMPEVDFSVVAVLKKRAIGFARPAKKSELLRAGLHALAALDDVQLKAALEALLPIKSGRPKKT